MLLDILLAVIILVCAALVGVILLQRSEGGVLGMSGGGTGSFMTARGTGDLLSTTTQFLAGAFFVLCLLMTVISGRQHAASSVADKLKLSINPGAVSSQPPASAPAPVTNAPPAPAAPFAPAAPANPLNLFGSAPQPHVAPIAKPAASPVVLKPKPAPLVAAPTATPKAVAVKAPANTPKPPAKIKAPKVVAPNAVPTTATSAAPPAPAISAPAPIVPPPPAAPSGQ